MRRSIPAILELIGKGLKKQWHCAASPAPRRRGGFARAVGRADQLSQRRGKMRTWVVASRPWSLTAGCVSGVSYTSFTGAPGNIALQSSQVPPYLARVFTHSTPKP